MAAAARLCRRLYGLHTPASSCLDNGSTSFCKSKQQSGVSQAPATAGAPLHVMKPLQMQGIDAQTVSGRAPHAHLH